MPRLEINTSYQAVCDCGNPYGDSSDNEMEAMGFIREFPKCSDCEGQ